MDIKIGDYVTRISHKHDMIFKVTKIEDDICYLSGVNVRLCADSNISDLVKTEYKISDDKEEVDRLKDSFNLNRFLYTNLKGKIYDLSIKNTIVI